MFASAVILAVMVALCSGAVLYPSPHQYYHPGANLAASPSRYSVEMFHVIGNLRAAYGTEVYVGNLAYEVTEEDIRGVFGEFGTVLDVKEPVSRETGRPRGYAFVQFQNTEDAANAVEALNGAEWMGRDLKVSIYQGRGRYGRRQRGRYSRY